jgi:UDP-glucose 4-epimerase
VGNGEQKRDFLYVSDVAEAFYLAAKSRAVNEIFNLGAGNPQKINYLAKLLGGDKKVYLPKRPGEPECTYANINKIKKLLSWKPKVSFEQGVAKMLENIDYWKDAPLWDKKKINKATKDWFHFLG